MHSYSTVSEALNKLSIRGHSSDFNINVGGRCLVPSSGVKLSPEDLQIDEV